ncbi:MAG TPA: NAD(P)-dependent alcohol dehydrogenase [Acidimicrobiaceae bacterium]|nr:NAD(P)-dependent alcohol dehydrogenase [Acidimicrobiaceae bacterium]
MKAITRHRYGSTDELEFEELPRPEIRDDQVLVRVSAAGVGRDVWHLMTGMPYLMRIAGFGVRAPKQPIIGRDVAGTVEAVGADVTRFRPGDQVFGTADGSFAEYAVAEQDHLAAKPAALGFDEAAALPVSGTAALEAARRGRIQPGQRVLVTGASGGVGSLAVQIARSMGAEVTGVSSTTKTDLVRSLGAAHVVDYTRKDFTRNGVRYDVILDVAGNRRLRDLRRALTPKGRLVIVGGEGGDRLTGGVHRQLRALLLSPFVGQTLTTFISKELAEDLDELARLADAGQLRPAIDRTWSLGEAADAIDHLQDGHARGKTVLTI